MTVQAPNVSISSTSDTDEFSRIEFPQDNANPKVCSIFCLIFKHFVLVYSVLLLHLLGCWFLWTFLHRFYWTNWNWFTLLVMELGAPQYSFCCFIHEQFPLGLTYVADLYYACL